MRRARPTKVLASIVLITLAAVLLASDLGAQAVAPDVLKAINFRNIGSTRQGGRFVDFAVPPLEPTTIYAASATGGLWKSVNNGTTWESIFDNQPVISIGDIAVAPSDPNIVWVGSGEATSSRSTYWGDGVYKSSDAGKTWTNMGLKESQHIGRIVVDPINPDIVYVAALGHLYSENEDRGLYKTTDGGKTWTKSLGIKVGDRAIGVCDVVMDPKNPKVLYAATYDKARRPWMFRLGGPGSGIYKTTDAGATWTKLTAGLPGGMIGRIGLDVARLNPDVVYANIENANKPGMSDADREKELFSGKASAGMIGQEVYRSDDAGKTWKKVSPEKQQIGGNPGYYYTQIRVDPNDVNHVYVLSVGVTHSLDGGKTWSSPFNFGGDNHGLWIDPNNSNHILLGFDHGMGVTWDGGRNWHHPDELPLAQLYAIGYDMQEPYNVYGGLQDNGSVRGPSSKRSGAIVFEDWQTVGGGDGMYNVMDTVTNRYLYNESQFGAIERTDLLTGEAKSIEYRGDNSMRFTWTTPIVVSPHDPNTIYVGGNKLLKSTNRGDNWVVISPDLSTNDPNKLVVDGKGGDGDIQACVISTLAESPIAAGLIYVGTDDGNVWVTKDDGKNWTKLNDNIKGNPGYWLSRVTPSSYQPGTAYVTYTGLRNDDFRAFVYKTTDFGQTWTSIAGNLPNKSINVIVEDPKNPNLLFVGVDFGIYFSIDGGKIWNEMKGFPTQPVHDLKIHPREHDLIVGTHGRGFYIADITTLEELDRALGQDVYLFDIKPKVKWVARRGNVSASLNFNAPSEPNGMVINYYLNAPVSGNVVIQILDGARVIGETNGTNTAGINQVMWNMRETPITFGEAPSGRGRGGGGGGFGGGGRGGRGGPTIPTFPSTGTIAANPGEYTIVIRAGNKTLSKQSYILEDVWFDKMF